MLCIESGQMALFESYVLGLKIIVAYNIIICCVFHFFTEVRDLRGLVIT